MRRPDPRGHAMLRTYRSAKAPPAPDRRALWARIEASLDAGAPGPSLEPRVEPRPRPHTRPLAPVLGVIVAVAAVAVAALALRPGQARDAVTRRAPSAAVHQPEPREPSQAVTTPRAEAPAEARAASPGPAVEPAGGRRRATASAGREPPAPAAEDPAVEATDALMAELALVREARNALRSESPARALELLDAHARAYPTGQMREDRLALRVEALCAAGKAAQARAEATLLQRAYPGSAHAQRVRATCAEP